MISSRPNVRHLNTLGHFSGLSKKVDSRLLRPQNGFNIALGNTTSFEPNA
jgi:hypothetical protein